MEFKDRKSEYPSRKNLIVRNMVKDESGDIKEMTVDIERMDGQIYEVGTELNAQNFNLMMKSIEKNVVKEITMNILTNSEVVAIDKNKLELPSTMMFTAELPQKGYLGSDFIWQVVSGAGINIDGNLALITRATVDQNVVIEATITYNGAPDSKQFSVCIPKIEYDQNVEIINASFPVFLDGSGANTNSMDISLNEDVNIKIKNDYPDLFNVTAIRKMGLNSDYITINVYANCHPMDGGISEYEFLVQLESKTTGKIVKILYGTIVYLESYLPID